MKQLAIAARACSQRLRGGVERLVDALPRRRPPAGTAPATGDELDGLVRRLSEQAEDLAALAATAREASIPMADRGRGPLPAEPPALGGARSRSGSSRSAASSSGSSASPGTPPGSRAGRSRSRWSARRPGPTACCIDKVYEPLLHVVRNAVGHGIEPPEDRARAGKPPSGRITLEARREGNTLVLAVRDDGRGLDHEAIAAKGRRLGLIGPDERPGPERLDALIFQPGFSTRGAGQRDLGPGRRHGRRRPRGRAAPGPDRADLEARAAAPGSTIRLPARLSLGARDGRPGRRPGRSPCRPRRSRRIYRADAVDRARPATRRPSPSSRAAGWRWSTSGPCSDSPSTSRDPCPTVLMIEVRRRADRRCWSTASTARWSWSSSRSARCWRGTRRSPGPA